MKTCYNIGYKPALATITNRYQQLRPNSNHWNFLRRSVVWSAECKTPVDQPVSSSNEYLLEKQGLAKADSIQFCLDSFDYDTEV